MSVADVSPLITVPLRNHEYDVPPVAVSTIEPPAHIDPFAGEIVPVGAVVWVMTEVFSAGPLHVPCLMMAK